MSSNFKPEPSSYLPGVPHAGNYAPSNHDAMMAQMRHASGNREQMETLLMDQRARFLTGITAAGMGGKKGEEWYNGNTGKATNLLLSGALNSAALSGMTGGSILDLRAGLSGAVGTGGMNINAGGMNQNIYGGGATTSALSGVMLRHMQSRFYSQTTGVAHLGRTHGMGMGELGGVAEGLAQRGAFAGGAPMFKGSTVDGQTKFDYTEAGEQRFNSSMESATKTLRAVKNIVGGTNVKEFFRVAEQITGIQMNSAGNAAAAGDRLQSVLRAGAVHGLSGHATLAMQTSAIQFGQALGLGSGTAAAVAHSSLQAGGATYGANRQEQGALQDRGIYAQSRSLEEIQKANVYASSRIIGEERDVVGALSFADDMGNGLTDAQRSKIHSQVSKATDWKGGAEGRNAGRAELRVLLREHGVDPGDYADAQGGAAAASEKMSPAARSRLADAAASEQQSRLVGTALPHLMASTGIGSRSGNAGAATTLAQGMMNGLSKEDAVKVGSLLQKGELNKANEIIGSSDYFQRDGKAREAFMGAVSTLGANKAGTAMLETITATKRDERFIGFTNEPARNAQRKQQADKIMQEGLLGGSGASSGGVITSVLRGMAGGETAISNGLLLEAMSKKDSSRKEIWDLKRNADGGFDTSLEDAAKMLKDAPDLKQALGVETAEELQAAVKDKRNNEKLIIGLGTSVWSSYGDADATSATANIRGAGKEAADAQTQAVSEAAQKKMFKTLTGIEMTSKEAKAGGKEGGRKISEGLAKNLQENINALISDPEGDRATAFKAFAKSDSKVVQATISTHLSELYKGRKNAQESYFSGGKVKDWEEKIAAAESARAQLADAGADDKDYFGRVTLSLDDQLVAKLYKHKNS